MIQLRKEGWGYSALGRKFSKDHTTIMYHCIRLGLGTSKKGREELTSEGVRAYLLRKNGDTPPPKKVHKYDHLLYEQNVNPGKSYKEYLKEAMMRGTERNYHKTYYETTITRDDRGRFSSLNRLAALSAILEEETRSGVDPQSTSLVSIELPPELRTGDKGDKDEYTTEVGP